MPIFRRDRPTGCHSARARLANRGFNGEGYGEISAIAVVDHSRPYLRQFAQINMPNLNAQLFCRRLQEVRRQESR